MFNLKDIYINLFDRRGENYSEQINKGMFTAKNCRTLVEETRLTGGGGVAEVH